MKSASDSAISPRGNISEAIQDVKDMIDVLDFFGSAYIYRHNGGRKRLENILNCLQDFKEANNEL